MLTFWYFLSGLRFIICRGKPLRSLFDFTVKIKALKELLFVPCYFRLSKPLFKNLLFQSFWWITLFDTTLTLIQVEITVNARVGTSAISRSKFSKVRSCKLDRSVPNIFLIKITGKHTWLKWRFYLFLCHFNPVDLLTPGMIFYLMGLSFIYSFLLILFEHQLQ